MTDSRMDFESFTDDELSEKYNDINKKIGQAMAYGMSNEVLNGLYYFLDVITDIKDERIRKEQDRLFNSQFPDILETGGDSTKPKKQESKKPLEKEKKVFSPPAFKKEYNDSTDK